MKIACLDTVTLIYALKEILPDVVHPDRVVEMVKRAKILIRDFEIGGVTIIIPAVVVSEYLAPIDFNHHAATMEALKDSFELPPFDLKAASIAARLWLQHRGLPVQDRMERSILKADVLIVATAKAFGVTDYYSNDKASRSLAEQAGLKAHDLPDRSQYLIPEVIEALKSKDKKSSPPEA